VSFGGLGLVGRDNWVVQIWPASNVGLDCDGGLWILHVGVDWIPHERVPQSGRLRLRKFESGGWI